MVALVADAGDDGAFDAADGSRLVLELDDRIDDLLDFCFRATWFDNDDHGGWVPVLFGPARLGRAAQKKPPRACGTV